MINQILLDLLASIPLTGFISKPLERRQIFDSIFGYEGIKRTFLRSLTSKEPVHILLVGPAGQAKTLFLKCILETFGEKKAFFTVGGNASKSGHSRRFLFLSSDLIVLIGHSYSTSSETIFLLFSTLCST